MTELALSLHSLIIEVIYDSNFLEIESVPYTRPYT